MPTKNPRISITLSPETHALVERVSLLAGNSKSALVADLLDSSLPVFQRMVTVLEAAAALRTQGLSATDEIKQRLSDAQTRLEDQLGLALDVMDDSTRSLLQDAEKVSRRSGRAPARAASRPAAPISNRGVKNLQDQENRTGTRSRAPSSNTGVKSLQPKPSRGVK